MQQPQPGGPGYGAPQSPPATGHPAPGPPYGPPGGPGYPPPWRPDGGPSAAGAPAGISPAARRSRRPILLLVAAVLALATVLATGAILRTHRTDPRGAAEDFLAALAAKDFGAAHDDLCASGKDRVSARDLEADFGLAEKSITSYRLTGTSKLSRDGVEFTAVRARLSYGTAGTDQVTVELEVVDERGSKICGYTVPG